MKPLTTDTFFEGRVRVRQGAGGYRYSIDAFLLASHVRLRAGDRVLDLGTGCGIIPLILAYRNPDITICGVEVQSELAELAALNIEDNRFADRVGVLCRDMKELKPDMLCAPVDVVVCNPPYRKWGTGRINPDRQRAVARHEIAVTLADVLQTARRMLPTAGKFVTIYTAERCVELLAGMRSGGIEPKYLRLIHSTADSEAKLVLVEGVRGAHAGCIIAPPLIVYTVDGHYTAEIQAMFAP